MPEQIDLLVEARWVIPVEPEGALESHSVAVHRGKILAVLPTVDAHRLYSPKKQYVLRNHALLPGFVNAHTHAAMSLMRGMADDLPLMEWLSGHVWPAEKLHVGSEFVYDGTKLACAEMLKGGTTTFNDMYFHPEAAARAVKEAGMRATIGMVVLDFSTPYASDCDDYLAKGLSARDEHGGDSRISFFFAPHAPYTVSDKSFSKVLTYAEELDLPIHVHLNETMHEVEESVEKHGMGPVKRLSRLGLLGPNLIAVHMVHADNDEIEMLAVQGCHVVHCPTSNLKLASGLAPVNELMDAGINVALGTDGAASNNRSDMLSELRLAALLAKGVSRKAEALPAMRALEMATLGGAAALGMRDEIGSLKPGKFADMVAVELSGAELSPVYDPVSHIVYCAGREHVSHVWVEGEIAVEEGRLCVLDEAALVAKAAWWKEKIAQGKAT